MSRRGFGFAGLVAAIALSACRPDPLDGSPYESQEPFAHDGGTADGDVNFLPGPDPFVAGQKRLSVGIFYEGGHTEDVPIDNMMTHLYVYEASVVLQTTPERIEGKIANEIVLTGKPWWGLGVHWDTARDLSAWTTLHVSFQATDAAYSSFTIG